MCITAEKEFIHTLALETKTERGKYKYRLHRKEDEELQKNEEGANLN